MKNVQSIFTSAKNPIIGPMALTVLVWVFLMNLMDLVPVDYLPTLAGNIAAFTGLVEEPGAVSYTHLTLPTIVGV